MERAPALQEYPNERIEASEAPTAIEHDFFHIDSLDRERLERYFEYLQRRLNDPGRYMDKGGAGYVYDVNGSMCIKMIEDRQKREAHRAQEEGRRPKKMDVGNTPYVEARIQETLGDFVVSGVRSPILVQYLPGKFWHGITMEKLDAVNLRKCLNGDEQVPETFEKRRFMNGLGDYFDRLHKERDVAHGDLEARNVMIDNATGNPVVIDFGRSRYLREENRKADEKADWDKYDQLYDAVDGVW